MYLDGDQYKLLQATIIVEARPACFTSTGMVIYFDSLKQYYDFVDAYYYDDSWRRSDWTSTELIPKKYAQWATALLIIPKKRYPNLTRTNLDQLSCHHQSGWKRLEI